MRITYLFAAVLSVFSAVGCASEVAPGTDSAQAELEQAPATLTFAGNYTVAQTGTLQAGKSFTLKYDTTRLSKCRGTYQGRPAFAITAFLQAGNAAPTTVAVAGANALAYGGVASVQVPLEAEGPLAVWFQETDVSGCMNFDSAYGHNYRFNVSARAAQGVAPDWMGAEAFVTSRATCNGTACAQDRHSLTDAFVFDTWTRQRAAVAAVYFDAWKADYTDRENPDLWKQFDAKIFYRFGTSGAFLSAAATIEKRVDNNVRYNVSLKALDPLGGYTRTSKDTCPKAPLTASVDGQYVQTTMQFYFSVNGRELRPSGGSSTYTGQFVDYRGLFAACL